MLGGIGVRRKRGQQRMRWHHGLDGRESEWTPGVGDGQGGLACCDSWGCKELDTNEWLNWLTEQYLQHLDCKEIQSVHSEGDQPWDIFGRNDAEAETPVFWPPHAKSWLIGKDSDAGRDWGQEEKGTTEDEMAGWHHWLDGRESEWTPGVGNGQGGLVCCNSWGHRVGQDWATELTDWLTDNKIDFKSKIPTRDTGHYIMIKGSIQVEDTAIVNINAPNIGAPQNIRQTLTDIKGEMDSNTIIVWDFNTPLTLMDRSSKQKNNKETQVLNDTLDEVDLIDIFRVFPTNAEYTFSCAHGTFSRIDHILGHKSNLLRKLKLCQASFLTTTLWD